MRSVLFLVLLLAPPVALTLSFPPVADDAPCRSAAIPRSSVFGVGVTVEGCEAWTDLRAGPSGGDSRASFTAFSPDGAIAMIAAWVLSPDGTTDVRVIAIDAATGGVLWETEYAEEGDEAPAGLAVDASRVYIVWESGRGTAQPTVGFVAFDLATGANAWATRTPAEAGWVSAAGIAKAGDLVVGAGTNGFGYAAIGLDPVSGAVVWSEAGSLLDDDWAGVYAFAASGDGAHVALAGLRETALDGTVFDIQLLLLEAASGAEVWERTLASADGSEEVPGQLAFSTDGARLLLAGHIAPAGQFFTAYDLRVASLNVADGTVLWNATAVSPQTSDAANGIVEAGGRVFALARRYRPESGFDNLSYELHAFDADDGSPAWSRASPNTPELFDADYSPGLAATANGSLALVASSLFAGANSGSGVTYYTREEAWLAAYDGATGGLVWDDVYSAPWIDGLHAVAVHALTGRVVAVGESAHQNNIYDDGFAALAIGVDAASGARAFAIELDGPTAVGEDAGTAVTVSADGETVYVAAKVVGKRGESTDVEIVAYDAGTGAVRWATRVGEDTCCAETVEDLVATPTRVFALGTTYRRDTHANWLVASLDAATGAVAWIQVLDTDGFHDYGADLALTGDGSTLVATGTTAKGWWSATNATVRALDSDTGSVLWTADYDGGHGRDSARSLALDETTAYVAAVSRGSVADDWAVAAFDLVDGAPRWSARAGGPGYDSPADVAVGGGRVAVTGTIVAGGSDPDIATLTFAAATGATLWTTIHDETAPLPPTAVTPSTFDSAIGLAFSPDGGRILAGVRHGGSRTLLVYDAATGIEVLESHDAGASTDFAVSADGRRALFVGQRDSHAETVAFDTSTGERLWHADYTGPNGQAFPVAVAVSDDGTRAFVVGAAYRGPATRNDVLVAAYAGRDPLPSGVLP